MEALLAFFSDMILFTAGIVVALLWVGVIMLTSVEIYDLITGNNQDEEEN